MDTRRKILERRARFVAAALAATGVSCNEPGASGPPVAAPLAASGEERPAKTSPLPTASTRDSGVADAPDPSTLDDDGDGIVNDLDACPRQPGITSTDPKKHGCPCLTIILPSVPLPVRVELDSNSAVLKPNVLATIDSVAATMKGSPSMTVSVEGHCDSTEPAVIADRRAQAVTARLVKMGVDPARITTAGFGATAPMESNTSAAGRAHNRRVEMRVVP